MGKTLPDPGKAVAVLSKALEKDDPGFLESAADALSGYGPKAASAKPGLIRGPASGGSNVPWRRLHALKAIGLDKSDLEAMKDLKLPADSSSARDILIELFALPEGAPTFVRNNPAVIPSFEPNDPPLVELFSRKDDGRDGPRKFLLGQKGLPPFLRIDPAKGESMAFVMGWPRQLDPKLCFPQTERVVKRIGDRVSVEDFDADPEYKLWVKDGLALLRIGEKWGFVDEKGTIVIAPAYDRALNFAGGVAPIIVGEKYGTIDRKGLVVVKPRFEWAYEFHDGLGAGRQGDNWGLINAKGEWVVEPVYARIDPLVGGLHAETFDGRKGFLNEKGEFRQKWASARAARRRPKAAGRRRPRPARRRWGSGRPPRGAS
ncbi:MAG: WG repeat-containing protein [Planctomycetes bacterium]|nr:WG repeat-containing protein [Planctomycetota bacterium]